MSERFIWETGHPRRKMHLAGCDRLGNFAAALCGIGHAFNRSCNLPLGRPRCKHCLAVEQRLLNPPAARDAARRALGVGG